MPALCTSCLCLGLPANQPFLLTLKGQTLACVYMSLNGPVLGFLPSYACFHEDASMSYRVVLPIGNSAFWSPQYWAF